LKRILLILFVFSTLAINAQEDSSRGYKVNVGDMSPRLNLNMLDGKTLTNADLKGKVVVLQFTASWCGVCRKEMPHLEKEVWQRFKGEDFLLIAVDLKEPKNKVIPFIEKTGISYPVAMDKDGSLFEAFTKPKAGVTRNIVLDKNGKIIFLSRLFKREEFDRMISTIDKELNKA